MVRSRPSWPEGVERLEFLHDRKASAHVFDFRNPFDEDGNPTVIDRESVKRTMGFNAVKRSA